MTYTAKILAHSKTPNSFVPPALTFDCLYPRVIHSELMTHRVWSRNASSSRAVPTSAIIKMVRDDPYVPLRWGLAGKGMQDHGEMSPQAQKRHLRAYMQARDNALETVERMLADPEKPAKQIVNRLLEPWSHIRVVITGTTFANFFAQRRNPGADPAIQALAEAMWQAYKKSTPELLEPGQWHLPYIQDFEKMAIFGLTGEERDIAMGNLIKMSAGRCARTSYNRSTNLAPLAEEDLTLTDMLITSRPMHASPLEHQLTPDTFQLYDQPDRETGRPKLTRVWDHPEQSGNLAHGWRQYRKTIPGENITRYAPDDEDGWSIG